MKSINPYTGKVIREFDEIPEGEMMRLIEKSGKAFQSWRNTSFEIRTSLLQKLAFLLREDKELYASTITSEMGKPFSESRAEVEKCAWVCEYYAENAAVFLGEEKIETDADISFVSYEPLGSVLGVMPWNFPFWQVFRFAAPTVMAGNAVLLKHSSNVQICAAHIEDLFKKAGFPPGVFINLVIPSGRVNTVIESGIVKAVSLTGSEYAGQCVAENAGRNLKKSLLELGGSNAFIVLPDADISKAAETGVKARMQNAGQSCIAAKRFIVHREISERFTSAFLKELSKLVPGDPMAENTGIGPLSSVRQAEEVENQLRQSVEMGARILAGGTREGAFFHPTLVTGVKPGMPLFDQEVFGPVAPVIIAGSTEEAVSLANLSKFGLGVSLFTQDMEKAKSLVPKFEDGAVFINSLVKSDPRLPFGGTKCSGYGRELSVHGIREFVNAKTVYIKKK